jgi:hypothetical protein
VSHSAWQERFITYSGHAVGKGRASTQHIYSHLCETDIGYNFFSGGRGGVGAIGLSRQKNWEQRTKVYVVKQFQS